MMEAGYISEADKSAQLADELLQNGYRVCLDPAPAELPFPLGNYSPDLVAFKDQGGLIVEIKTNSRNISIDRFQEIATDIAAHPGWRFVLVTLDDIGQPLFPADQHALPSWDELSVKTGQIYFLLSNHMPEPALMYLWSLVEAALRRRAFVQLIPIERMPALKLLNHMYSSGEISVTEHEVLKLLFEKQNKVAHGMLPGLNAGDVRPALDTLEALIGKWHAG